MPTKTFQIELVKGHSIIKDGENSILIDTGSPVSIHSDSKLIFMNYKFDVKESFSGISIDDLNDFLGTKISTLLGMDILKYYRIIFDYPNNRMTFSTKNLNIEGEKIPLKLVSLIPVIEAEVNGLATPCFFDTGASLSYFSKSLTKDMKVTGEENDFYPGFGRFSTSTFQVNVEVGTKKLTVNCGNLPLALESKLLRLVNGNNGILGYDLLMNFKIYMDGLKEEFLIAESLPNDNGFQDDMSEDMPDFMKSENIWKELRRKKEN